MKADEDVFNNESKNKMKSQDQTDIIDKEDKKNSFRNDNENKRLNSLEIDCKLFTYLDTGNQSGSFYYEEGTKQEQFSITRNKLLLVVSILVPSDSAFSSEALAFTLNSIKENKSSLKSVSINSEDILIIIYFDHLYNEKCFEVLFNSELNDSIQIKADKFLLNFVKYKSYQADLDGDSNSQYQCLLINKGISSKIEYFKTFYSSLIEDAFISDLSTKSKLFHSVITAGQIIPKDGLVKLMTALVDKPQEINVCGVGVCDTEPNGLFAMIQQYENFHYNIYDLPFYYMSCSVPANSKFCLWRLSSDIVSKLKDFYRIVNADCSISFHDYYLSLFTQSIGKNVIFSPNVISTAPQKDLTIAEVLENYSEKMQGLMAMNHKFLSEGISAPGLTIQQKLNLFLHLFGSLFNFLFPTFCIFIIWASLYEGFNQGSGRACQVITTLYAIFIICIIGISLAVPKPTKLERPFTIIAILMVIYYIVVFCTACAGVDYVRKQSSKYYYKFNKGAMISIIIINFAFGIIPYCLNVKKLFESKNIIGMCLYLFIGAPNYTSLFLVHSTVNQTDSKGIYPSMFREESINPIKNKTFIYYENKEGNQYSKGIFVLIYVLCNSLLAFFILLMDNRKKRMNCVLALSIIFTVYHCLKMLSILFSFISYSKTCSNTENPEFIKVLQNEINDCRTNLGKPVEKKEEENKEENKEEDLKKRENS
ncbi:MAG: hypothetical protein MJ252_20435, partial [archaeon]|nr:hypothetical protein [archaeon]